MAAKKRKSPKKKAAANNEVLVVSSKIKAAIKDAGCNTSGDAIEGINQWVYWLIEQASERAKMNGRKTVRNHDFMAN